MRKIKLIITVGIGLLSLICPQAEAEVGDGSWGILTGYKYIDLDFQYTHDTHQDDSYIPDGHTPGSAGTSELGGTSWFFLGGRFQVPLSHTLYSTVDAGMIFGGDEEKIKYVNDYPDRDDLNIYSRSSFGTVLAAALNYQATDRVSCGIEGQVTGVRIESGYHRWGTYDARTFEWSFMPSIGPKAGVKVADGFSLETAYYFGANQQGSLTLSYEF